MLAFTSVSLGQAPAPSAPPQPAETAADLFPTSPPAAPAAPATAAVPEGASGLYKARQSQVHGLLVRPLPNGKEAGFASRMNATVVAGGGPVTFNQDVGETMTKALNEVLKYTMVRNPSLSSVNGLEIAFADKYSGKDGPSAAVACALLIEGAITGKTWDPAFAVTGDMNADGSVQPIGGVGAKVRGATNGSCKVVAVPAKNASAVLDLLVMDGPAPLAGICVFSISHFDEAVALASTQRTEQLQLALDEFETVKAVLLRDRAAMSRILHTPQAITRLQAIVAKAPNCLSAKGLLLVATDRVPRTLSLGGSIAETDSHALKMVAAIKSDFSGSQPSTLKLDDVGGSLTTLRTLRPRLDPRVWPYLDSLVKHGEAVRQQVLNPARSAARAREIISEIETTAEAVAQAKRALMSDPTVLEELER